MMPTEPVPRVLAELFTDGLRRPIGLRELGLPEDVPVDLGLAWGTTARATVKTVATLWRADMERRSLLLGSAWTASGFATPTREWLLDWLDEDTSHAGGRRVGEAEVEVIWSMSRTFADTDHRLGGGYARSTLVHYVNEIVLPLLDGTYPDRIGRLLMAAVARLCDLGGFMAFDSGRGQQGLAQRYYIQALRLAQAAGDHALGAHILSDMAMQAHYLGNSSEACSLARAGQRSARASGSYSTLARCCALEARAHALAGDGRRCGDAMARAEDALARVRPEDEPFWIGFFTLEQLHAEFAYAAADLGRVVEVQRFASTVLTASDGMERRQVLVSAALASSYLPANDLEQCHGSKADVEAACAVLRQTVPLVRILSTRRGVEAVNGVRRRLKPFAGQPPVRELEASLEPILGAAA
ncbi:hypothetical protein AB0873_18445 [Micromonospora sp. NPDC047707]|uniref:hypothetical protein n=1 Tax=Micromonospora sp. NPDC047707 TaxID=3154498 RepID=UPI003453D51D